MDFRQWCCGAGRWMRQSNEADETDAMSRFGWMFLWFPVMVTVCTALSFLFGSRCSIWQWWAGVAGVLVMGGVRHRHQWRRLLWCIGLLLLFLGCYWLFSGAWMTAGWTDLLVYHLPAMRLLIEGWNPLQVSMPEMLPTGGGAVNQWEMQLWHIVSMPKGPWYFCAEAWFFTRATFALTCLLFPFLFITVSIELWRFLQGCPRGICCLAIVGLWVLAPGCGANLVDSTTMLAGVGVLVGMGAILKGKRGAWEGLLVHTFWMMSCKQIALTSCFLFWVVFCGALAWQQRRLWRVTLGHMALVGGGAVLLWGSVNLSPYWTAWRNYSHPLYPCYTVDEARFPVHNFVGDFDESNEDAAAMGHIGLFLNAYACPTWVRRYYAWQLKRPHFAPSNPTWQQGAGVDAPMCQTSLETRLLLLVCLFVIACYGGKVERLLGVMIVLGLFLVPTQMVGYTRYVPWYGGCVFVATAALVIARKSSQRPHYILGSLLLGGVTAYYLPATVIGECAMFDARYAVEILLDTCPPKIAYAYPQISPRRGYTQQEANREPNKFNPLAISAYGVRQLCCMEPRLSRTEVATFQAYTPLEASYPIFPGASFILDEQERSHLEAASLFANNLREPSRQQRFLNYPAIVVQCYGCRLPKLLWRKFLLLVVMWE